MPVSQSIFESINKLPDPSEFPTNIRQKTKEFLDSSFEASSNFTIVTGYSSLEFLISFFSGFDFTQKQMVRIVLGNEPLYRDLRREMPFTSLPQEITDYWLNQSIAANLCWPVINLIEQIREGKVFFRFLDGLHAKIYVGDNDAILGSSNFSQSGLVLQKEANVRAEKNTKPDHFLAFQTIANYYFEQGQDANDFILNLLQKLLQLVSWREALARAVGELLEGDTIRHDPRVAELFHNLQSPLWRVQEEAIGQALYILDNFGSVLIADATGSGKTRLGAALQLCLKNRISITGGKPNDDNTLLISPPQVIDNWHQEFLKMGSEFSNMASQGILSRSVEDENDRIFIKVNNARIIMLDEAHNYLSVTSKRSERLQFNLADHLILLTATPINRKFEDIFRLIEIMDIDNLDDVAIQNYQRLYKIARKGSHLSQSDKEQLQSYLSQFLVRRTKRELNRRVDENPEAHRLPSGRLCRYPQQLPSVYPLNETDSDITLAKEINQLAARLRGIIRLRNILLKAEERANPEIENQRLQQRLNAAKALSQYAVQATLRSSNAALIEHIEGTVAACMYLEVIELPLKGLKEDKSTGNMIGKLEEYQDTLPVHNLSIPLPDWLSDPVLYQKACLEEIDLYRQISNRARNLSLQRELQKAKFLHSLLKKHPLVLSFDRNIITLNVINRIIKTEFSDAKPLLVTGKEKSNQAIAKQYFNLGSTEKGWIGLCSEVMSEGVNLQQASAVVLLDVPGVMRIAEQRIGRIDRMNSPHDQVEIYFPNDHPEFALRTDRKFFLTAQIVDDMIGGNVDLPEEMLEKWKVEVITGEEIAKQYGIQHEKAAQSFADGIQDAFKPVKDLVSGETPLIDPAIYLEIRRSQATLTSLVRTGASFVSSRENWGFFCLRSTASHSSVWLFVQEKPTTKLFRQYEIVRSLPEISDLLRTHLADANDITNLQQIAQIQPLSDRLFVALRDFEIESLPNKKRRAIHLLLYLIDHYLNNDSIDTPRREVLLNLKKLLKPADKDAPVVDYYHLSRHWIRLIQPYIVDERKKQQRNQPTVHLGTMLKVLKMNPLPTSVFEKLFRTLTLIVPIEKRIAAYIIGIKED